MDTKDRDKIKSLFLYLRELVRLSLKVYRKVEEHNLNFILYLDKLPKNEDIKLFSPLNDDLAILSVKRQDIKDKPEIDKDLLPFVNISDDLYKKPVLRDDLLIEDKEFVLSLYNDYIKKWQIWRQQVKDKIEVQNLYNKLFKLNERLKYDSQLELIAGYGILLYKGNNYEIRYPLITQRLVIEQNASKGIISFFAQEDSLPKLELDMIIDTDLPDLIDIKTNFQNYLSNIDFQEEEKFFSSFNPLLKEIAGRLTPEGKFLEKFDFNKDFIPSKKLKILPSWVIFLRKRRQDAILQDIDIFLSKLNKEDVKIPLSLLSYVRSLDTKNKKFVDVNFDEWSVILDKNIYFPLPANEEQVQVINRFWQVEDGIIVWGPPGTGKSHTIANLISHFMAEGKRVLVSSQKDQALSVLADKLPPQLRPLCMSVLTNDRKSRERLEKSVSVITEIVTQSQDNIINKEIENYQLQLDNLSKTLKEIELKIKGLLVAPFRYIKFDNDVLLLPEVIKKLKLLFNKHLWLEDNIDYNLQIEKIEDKEVVIINPLYPLKDEEVEKLKHLWYKIKDYITDFNYNLIELDEVIDIDGFKKIYSDLTKINQIENNIKEVLPDLILKIDDENIIDKTLQVLDKAIKSKDLIDTDWQNNLLNILKEESLKSKKLKNAIIQLSSKLNDLITLYEKIDILKIISFDLTYSLQDTKNYVLEAISNLRNGKTIFNILDFLNKKKKNILTSILINEREPENLNDWNLVLNYINLMIFFKTLKLQWNNFAKSISAPLIEDDVFSIDQVEYLIQLLKKTQAPYNFYNIYLPEVDKVLSKLVVNFDKMKNKFSLDLIYEGIKLLKETKAFKESKDLLKRNIETLQKILTLPDPHPLFKELLKALEEIENKESLQLWQENYLKLKQIHKLLPELKKYKIIVDKLFKTAPKWAEKFYLDLDIKEILPEYWKQSIYIKSVYKYIIDINNKTKEIALLEQRQNELIRSVREIKKQLILSKVKSALVSNMTDSQLSALKRWHLAVRKLGKGKGKYSWKKQRLVKKEMQDAKDAVPIWIMPLYKVSEIVPAEFSAFDVLIIDEASQCDIRALLAIARAKKVIIVGDPEQISPDAVGINEDEVRKLINIYLKDIENKNYFDLQTSLYDLSNIAFSTKGAIMLKEHFRSVPEIIEFSNKLCYSGKILPLRNPPLHKKLVPVLENIYIENADRSDGVNLLEAVTIAEKVNELVNDSRYKGKTIGVVSLLGSQQAKYISNIIGNYITLKQQEEIKFRVGDSYSFQGDERDIMLLSMVIANDSDKRFQTLKTDNLRYRQRFNVSVSRARDKLILFHSVNLKDLNTEDIRYHLLKYILDYKNIEIKAKFLGDFESPLERDVYNLLVENGYKVSVNVKVGHYRIDLVVEGKHDRLAVICDGYVSYSVDTWWDMQMKLRRLQRMGWHIFRIWASQFYLNQEIVKNELFDKLKELKIGEG